MDGYVVGAYIASPTAGAWNPELETDYFDALAADPRIGAFELPWMGSLHTQDEEWLFAHLPERLGAVLTDVARVSITVSRDNEYYGLASNDDRGRELALRDAALLRDDVRRFNDRLGRSVVRAVELHPGPRAMHGSSERLARSLAELGAWDWDGAELVIEHSDALVPEHEPEKGFLTLVDEIAAIRAAATEVGIALNWGRSAIEFHDADRVIEHIGAARSAGLLRGYIFSGASDWNGIYDHPWVDAHNAFRQSETHPLGDPISLLTDERVAHAVAAIGPDAWLGAKVAWPSGVPGTVAQRSDMIGRALDSLDAARGI